MAGRLLDHGRQTQLPSAPAPAVVDRPDASTEREAGSNRPGDVVLGRPDRARHVEPGGQPGRDRGGERATGPVGVPVVVAGGAQLQEGTAVGEQVERLPGEVTALD